MTPSPPFRRLLVANRGEIAIRILRAANELGIRTIAIYSHEDRFALHRFKADEAYQLGRPGEPVAAYLDAAEIVDVARRCGAEAIHPGYGFLSEDADFATSCLAAGIKFVGPSPATLRIFGDKVAARGLAKRLGIPLIPGTFSPVESVEEAIRIGREIGFPLVLKAVSGGGGRGIRMVDNEEQLRSSFATARSEAKTSFGRAEIYLEKQVLDAKHIEIQILGDPHGNIVHLFERDCSIQRRNQKVVEVAPALGITDEVRNKLYVSALAIARAVNYVGLCTVEFLVDREENAYFLEVNPRVQVEHTVTEMITGIDLVQASILTASGCALSHPGIGITSQDSIQRRGVAIQCRITTEDPQHGFAPDTGTIIAYRPAAGFGIRLDEGMGTAGAIVTPHYDSLLVKVTAWALTLDSAAAKMRRSLREFRIRGVRHNIPVLLNVAGHPTFLGSEMTTRFFDEHKELYKFPKLRDRATKMLKYLADVTVNNPHGLPGRISVTEPPLPDTLFRGKTTETPRFGGTAKDVLRSSGPDGLRKWIMAQPQLLLTDTTMRDAHQSLFATRLRTRDILRAAPFYAQHASAFFSLEVWGGATFDTALRFLKEDPWERLAKVRELVPNILLQMLMRGDNAVGYSNYPEWVIRDFVKETVATGLDIFRIFDCLNQPDKMAIAIDEVKKRGAVVEACICYTGNVTDSREGKYTLSYYLKVARELASMGADILCIKDMAGLLRPKSAATLVRALRETINLPIHIHTHDTAGVGVAMLLEAAGAGAQIVDGAISSMSGLTSQPSINALVAAMSGGPRAPAIPLEVLDALGRYWGGIRQMYQHFDPHIQATSTDVYEHEIPGGQYSNLFQQAAQVGLSISEFYELTQRYKEVNTVFGNIVKVTPSSKVVGDMALLLQKKGLTGETWLATEPKLDYPDSVLSFFKGHMGTPYGGFPEKARRLVLGENAAPPEAPPIDGQDSFSDVAKKLETRYGPGVKARDVLSARLYPKVYAEFRQHRDTYGAVDALATPHFLYGLTQGEEVATDLEPGKTLFISLSGISDADLSSGARRVFFGLNGFPREIEITDEKIGKKTATRAKADPDNPKQIGAAMPGKVVNMLCRAGDVVKEGQVILVTESMKMEYQIAAKSAGTVGKVAVVVGDVLEGGDLLIEMK